MKLERNCGRDWASAIDDAVQTFPFVYALLIELKNKIFIFFLYIFTNKRGKLIGASLILDHFKLKKVTHPISDHFSPRRYFDSQKEMKKT